MAARYPKHYEERETELIKENLFNCVSDVQLKMAIANNIHVACIQDAKYGLMFPNSRIKYRMASYACYNQHALRGIDIIKLNKPSPLKKSQFNMIANYADRSDVQDAIRELMLKKRELPTFKMLESILDLTDDSTSSMLYITQLGYRNQNLPGTNLSFVIEEPEYVRERYHYLTKMQKFRKDGRHFVYIHEFHRKSDSNPKINKYYVAVSPINGVINKTAMHTSITQWLENIVIPMLPENSVVIMEEDKSTSGALSKGSLKRDMTAWLDEHNIPYKTTMHRVELYNLIVNTTPQKLPLADRLKFFQENQATLMYRPFHMPEFTIFKSVLDKLMKSNEISSRADESSALYEYCTGSNSNNIDWQKLDSEIAKKEQICLEQDRIIDDLIDQILTMSSDGEFTAEDLAKSGLSAETHDDVQELERDSLLKSLLTM